VDGDAQTLTTSAESLRQAGFHVLTATGGMQAIGILAHQQTDLAFVDLVLVDMKGLEFARLARALGIATSLIVTTRPAQSSQPSKPCGSGPTITSPNRSARAI
jgi:DNA-binding response OmpR family regulator